MSSKASILDALTQMNERPQDIARSMRKFQQSARARSSDQPRLIDEYPDQWVAVMDGAVIAHGTDLNDVLQQVDRKGFRRSEVPVRFIERTPRILILLQYECPTLRLTESFGPDRDGLIHES